MRMLSRMNTVNPKPKNPIKRTLTNKPKPKIGVERAYAVLHPEKMDDDMKSMKSAKKGGLQMPIKPAPRQSIDVRKSFTKDLHVLVKSTQKEQMKQQKTNQLMMGLLEKMMEKIEEEVCDEEEQDSPLLSPKQQLALHRRRPTKFHSTHEQPLRFSQNSFKAAVPQIQKPIPDDESQTSGSQKSFDIINGRRMPRPLRVQSDLLLPQKENGYGSS